MTTHTFKELREQARPTAAGVTRADRALAMELTGHTEADFDADEAAWVETGADPIGETYGIMWGYEPDLTTTAERLREYRAQATAAAEERLRAVRGMAGYRNVLNTLRREHEEQLRMAANAEQVDCREYTGEAACAADAIAAVLKLLEEP